MQVALEEARAAADQDEVPVGAVVERGGKILARAHNLTRTRCDPTAHAELLALRAAARRSGYARLEDAKLFVTLEPCFMCAGALVHARIARVVFARRDPKFGACASLGRVLDTPGANHQVAWDEGLLAGEARDLLQAFFRAKRSGFEAGGGLE